METKVLLLTPPLLQTNAPYPATMHLLGWMDRCGIAAEQRDLSIKVVRDVLCRYGDESVGELLEFLGGPAPLEAKRDASAAIENLAIDIRDRVDPDFGFGRYAEHLCQSVDDFGELEKRVKRRGVIDEPLERHLAAAIGETCPTEVWVTCPFPGTLVGAFKIARWLRKNHPRLILRLGGGYVNTELRQMNDKRPKRYFDDFQFDCGYENVIRAFFGCGGKSAGEDAAPAKNADRGQKVPEITPFVAPSYRGVDWSDYFDIVETDNYVTNLWNCGKWVKLVMAQGCYWHRCAFCDVVLPYIGDFRMPEAVEIADALERFARPADGAAPRRRFHFVDEAMPPALVKGVCEEILRRKLDVEWWGNIRFDAAFTPALARLMAKAGCICVTGGLECANDRLLALMNKGITLASAEKVLAAFKRARIFVHCYLMYDFPSETRKEQREAERYVKSLARRGLVQSVFWHRFALTVHSPIARDPEKFGIALVKPRRRRRVFACNELQYAIERRPMRKSAQGMESHQ